MSSLPATRQLERLEAFLRQDPDNGPLRAEAFDAAMNAADWASAERHLRHAATLTGPDAAWRLREAHWLLAQQQLDAADAVLHALTSDPKAPEELRPVLAHDRAYIALRRGDATGGRALLAPWVESAPAAEAMGAGMQVLWLRLLHRLGELDAAMRWADARWRQSNLDASASGVASLIALDANDFARCAQWAEHALQVYPQQSEALIARGSVALAQRDAATARRLLQVVLGQNPRDGRAWSAMGFTELLSEDLAQARSAFDKAVQFIPGHIGTWHGAGWSALMQQDLEGARRCFETALALDPNFSESHGGLAVVQVLQAHGKAAAESIQRALRLDRNNMSARYAEALLKGDAKDMQGLRRLAERLLGGVAAPMGGGSVADLLPGGEPSDP